jgi:hypothetical protein
MKTLKRFSARRTRGLPIFALTSKDPVYRGVGVEDCPDTPPAWLYIKNPLAG